MDTALSAIRGPGNQIPPLGNLDGGRWAKTGSFTVVGFFSRIFVLRVFGLLGSDV